MDEKKGREIEMEAEDNHENTETWKIRQKKTCRPITMLTAEQV